MECVHKDLIFMNVKIGEKTSPRRLHHPNRPVVSSADIPRLVACSLQKTPRLVDHCEYAIIENMVPNATGAPPRA